MCDSDFKLRALCNEQCSVQQYIMVLGNNTTLFEGLGLAFRLTVISRGPVGTGEWNGMECCAEAGSRQLMLCCICVIYIYIYIYIYISVRYSYTKWRCHMVKNWSVL